MLRSTGAYGGEKREEVGVAGSPSHLQSGEFRLNLVTKCLWESPFPHLHSEVVPKEFPKHQIQWQQYGAACYDSVWGKSNKDLASLAVIMGWLAMSRLCSETLPARYD